MSVTPESSRGKSPDPEETTPTPKVPGQAKPGQVAKSFQADMTDAENRLWACLCAADLGGVEFHAQYAVGSYTVDFCAPHQKLIIEVDDPHAVEHDEFYAIRNAWLAADGWRLLRFTSHDALKNSEAVLSVILAVLQKSGPAAVRAAAKSLEGMMDFEI